MGDCHPYTLQCTYDVAVTARGTRGGTPLACSANSRRWWWDSSDWRAAVERPPADPTARETSDTPLFVAPLPLSPRKSGPSKGGGCFVLGHHFVAPTMPLWRSKTVVLWKERAQIVRP
eukprot:gene19214-biopygen6968